MLTALAATGTAIAALLSQQANREQISILEQGQITDRITKATEQLGNTDSLVIRLGGIYALERIAGDSVRDHHAVMEIFSVYVREHAPLAMCKGMTLQPHPATDVQAILTAIGRRDEGRGRVDLALNGTCLRGAYLAHARLAGAGLTGADLAEANLTDADLRGTYLGNAHLANANLTGANLTGAHLANANLTGANLTGTQGLG